MQSTLKVDTQFMIEGFFFISMVILMSYDLVQNVIFVHKITSSVKFCLNFFWGDTVDFLFIFVHYLIANYSHVYVFSLRAVQLLTR